MSKRKQNLILTITLIMLLMPQVVVATTFTIPQKEAVEKILNSAKTPEEKAAAVVKLMNIVKDEKAGILLRKLAAEKLCQLRAVEAKDMLKTLVDSLEWNVSHKQAQLNRAIVLSYWQIRVSLEPTKKLQNDMLIELLDVVPDWAIDELSNRGVKKALPEITKILKYRYRSDVKRAEARIKLCTTKINLLTNNITRHEASCKALIMEDTTDHYQRLKKWAVEELGKLDSAESRQFLIDFAKDLENKYIDSRGNTIKTEEKDWLGQQAGNIYRSIIKILKSKGFSDDKIKAQGLNADKVFIMD